MEARGRRPRPLAFGRGADLPEVRLAVRNRAPRRPAAGQSSARRFGALPTWILLLPLLVLMSMAFYFPIVRLLLTSVTDGGGIANYEKLIAEPLFGTVFLRTL